MLRAARGRAAAALALCWAIPFVPFLLSGMAPFYRDELLTALPLRAYASARLRAGALPQWFPFEALGVPFIGQIPTATFHPFTLLLLPFPPLFALELQVALSFALGLFGAYRAARALPASRTASVTGAIAFAFGGYALGVSHNPSYLLAHQTLPLVLWAALRIAAAGPAPRRIVALGVGWALVFLAGDLQEFGLCPLLLLAALSWAPRRARQAFAGFTAAGVLALLLSAAEFVPALLLSRGTIRVAGQGDPLLGRFFSFHPLRLFELAAPSLIPDALRVEVTTPLFHDGGALWATTVFAGALALLLGALAPRRAWGFAALAAVSLALAMGAHAGLLPLLQRALPPLGWFRFPEKYAAFAWVALVPLVASGFDSVRADPVRARKAMLGAGLLAALLCVVAPVLVPRLFTGPAESAVIEATASAWQVGFLWSACVLAAAAGLIAASVRRPLLLCALPALLFLELAHGNHAHLPLAPRAVLESEHPFAAVIRAAGHRVIPLAGGRALRTVTGGDVRWAEVMRASLRPDASGLEHVGSLAFNLPATQRRAWRALGPNASLRSTAGPLFDGCWAITDLDGKPPAGSEPLLEDARLELRLYRVACRPRVYLSAAEPVDERAAAATLHRGLAAGQSIWEAPSPALAAEGSVTLVTDEPEEMVLDASASGPTALVINDELTPGWTATLDGAPAPLYVTNVAVRGLALPAGHHRVELRYRTPGLTAGLWLSALGLLLCAAASTNYLNRPTAEKISLKSSSVK